MLLGIFKLLNFNQYLMKLSECKIGEVIVDQSGNIGHIVGLTYNVELSLMGNMPYDERISRTIPLVKFPFKEQVVGIHYNNIELYKDLL